MSEVVIAGFRLKELLLFPAVMWGIILIGNGVLFMIIYLAKKGALGKFCKEDVWIKKEGVEKIIRYFKRIKKLHLFFIFGIPIYTTLKTMWVIIFEGGIIDTPTAQILFVINYFLIVSCFLPSYLSFVFMTKTIKMLPLKDE
ncbi:MAG: hypothetical protein QME42_02575 [bacterium]|nr:hypothetical protein [bacterium]